MAYQGGIYASPTWVNGQAPAINQSELQDMNTAINSAQRGIGEMLLTLRTVSDGDYLECDGTQFDAEDYPDLAKLLPTASEEQYNYPLLSSDTVEVTEMIYAASPNGKYLVCAEKNAKLISTGTSTNRHTNVGLYDKDTDTWVSLPTSVPYAVGETFKWQAIDVADNGMCIVAGVHYDSDDYTLVLNIFDCNTRVRIKERFTPTSWNKYEVYKVSINNNRCFMLAWNTDAESSWSDRYQIDVRNIDEQYSQNWFDGNLSSDVLFAKLFDNGKAAYAYIDSGTPYFYVNLEDLTEANNGYVRQWKRYATGITNCETADINSKGETVAIIYNNSNNLELQFATNYANTFETFTLSETLFSVSDVTINDDGKVFFTAYTTVGNTHPIVSFLCDIHTGEYQTFTNNEYPMFASPIMCDGNTVLACVDASPLRLITSDGQKVFTSNNEAVYVKSSVEHGKTYICNNVGADGKVPDSEDIMFSSSLGADKIGNLYIHGKITTPIEFVNWQNGVTKLSAENLNKLSPSIANLQLQIGDFLLSTRTDLDTIYDNQLIKCSGQTITNADYPLLYPLVNAFYSEDKLPNFESEGISGVHLYVRAK